MLRSAGWGVAASLFIGVLVGLWAAIANAPPEVAGGVASGLGAAFGLFAFGASITIRTARRVRSRPAYARAASAARFR